MDTGINLSLRLDLAPKASLLEDTDLGWKTRFLESKDGRTQKVAIFTGKPSVETTLRVFLVTTTTPESLICTTHFESSVGWSAKTYDGKGNVMSYEYKSENSETDIQSVLNTETEHPSFWIVSASKMKLGCSK